MGLGSGAAGGSRGSDRPGVEPHTLHVLAVPDTFPEAIAYEAGSRLAIAEADEVPMMLRAGLPIDQHLQPGEISAHLELGDRAFERWFRLGWSRAANDEEE